MIVLLPYAPGRDAEQDRDNHWPTRAAIVASYPTRLFTPSGENGYADAILDAAVLGEDLMIVEGDIEPAAGIAEEFNRCPYAACTSPYILRGGSTSLIDPVTRVALPITPDAADGRYLQAISGLGCVRLRSYILEWLDPDAIRGPWGGLDERLSREILRLALGWHVHRPVQKHWGRP